MFNLTKIKQFGNKNVLQYFEAADSIQMYSYADLYKQSTQLSRCLRCFLRKLPSRSIHSMQSTNVAILLPIHSPALLPTIVGIEHADGVSCFMDPTDNFQVVRARLIDFQTNILLCDSKSLDKLHANDDKLNVAFMCTIFDTECAVVQFNDVASPNENLSTQNVKVNQIQSSKVFFYASTSGSCGDSKIVGVTYKCFMPNITSLRKTFSLTEDDVIFVSSPQTFDPFMVDICLAIHHGASLLMTSHIIRCNASELLDILFPCRKASNVSVMQITPSLFMRWASADIKHRIFSQKSHLRILAFGGEPFPATNTLRRWTNGEHLNSIRIFNLYGLTEMSCWAGIYEITKDDILCNRKVPIGQPTDPHTKFQMTADGELLLRSTVRKCYQPQLLSDEEVCSNDFEFVLHTGDTVIMENGSYYFQSRVNSVIKFYGRKIDLAKIEAYTKNVKNVEDAVCLFNEKQNSITLFVKVDGNFENIKREIVKALRMIEVRVKIIGVSKFPLTKHGKICKNDLLNTTHVDTNDAQSRPIELIAQELINETLGTTIQFSGIVESFVGRKKFKEECHSSFVHLGGNSLKAIQIVGEFERITTHSMSYLLPMLLDERTSIHEILSRLANDKTCIGIHGIGAGERKIEEILPRWKIDMGKCIDATPTVCLLDNDEAIVSVGSHSKLLYNVSIESGECISKLKLPDRIESQVIQMGDFGFFGCYDGCMHCFDIRSGSLKWKFDTGGMIKCRALLINRSILFGNYNESNNFWCLDIDHGSLIWTQKIGSKSIYANPVEIENGNALACSLDGTVAMVNSSTAKVLWYFQSEAPVFSTPTVFRNNHNHQFQVVILAVNGTMYGLNSDGVSLWSHHIDGNIFSSPEHFASSMDEKCTNIVFGSQNRNVYCHRINADNECNEVWKFTTSAPVRSNPILVEKEHGLFVAIFSSDGIVTIVNSRDGKLISQCRINGEIFSSPVIHNGNLFVGSRNNCLYCINLNDLI